MSQTSNLPAIFPQAGVWDPLPVGHNGVRVLLVGTHCAADEVKEPPTHRWLHSRIEGRPIFRKLIRAQVAANAADLNGKIEGRLGIATDEGQVVPCTGASVHLLLKPIDFDTIKKKAAEKDGIYNPRLAHMYVEYVMSSPEMQAKLSYAKTKTNAKGQFVFSNLPGGRWYYVTAQALTGPVLVSWQVAVYLNPKERIQVFLHNANAALPMYVKQDNAVSTSPA